MSPRKPVILLLGPTAVGKTDISIKIAKALGAEIVSVDSQLLYRGMDIGTAKPSSALRTEVRHHLVDIAPPTERWSLSRYLDAVKKAISDIHARVKVPLLVGGTGQYFAALVEGWQPPPKADDRDFRRELQKFADEQGEEALHDRLHRLDPVTAERIDARNIRRVIRALEIHHVTGALPSEQRRKSPPDYEFLFLGLRRERSDLYERIDKRIEAMIANGWVQEVEALLDQGIRPNSPAFSAIGYRQIAQYLQEEIDKQTAIVETQRLTRQLVRRQGNWFRRFGSRVHWFEAESDPSEEMIAVASAWLAGELSGEA